MEAPLGLPHSVTMTEVGVCSAPRLPYWVGSPEAVQGPSHGSPCGSQSPPMAQKAPGASGEKSIAGRFSRQGRGYKCELQKPFRRAWAFSGPRPGHCGLLPSSRKAAGEGV